MKYPDDVILFELLNDNNAPIPVGEVVEFSGWSRCDGAIEARHAFGNACGFPYVDMWTYHWTSLRPLTTAARNIMESLS